MKEYFNFLKQRKFLGIKSATDSLLKQVAIYMAGMVIWLCQYPLPITEGMALNN
jgi:hypothetical protein